jgi:hypothetical protein
VPEIPDQPTSRDRLSGTFEWVVPADVDITPCPEGCGGLTEDPYGGPCAACWRRIDAISQRRWWEDE